MNGYELAYWEHWKNPRTGLWDAHCFYGGYVLFASRQGYANKAECLNAIERTTGSRNSRLVHFANRKRSPRRRK